MWWGNFYILLWIILLLVACHNATTTNLITSDPDIPASSLTGASSAIAVETSFNVSITNRCCPSNSFAKYIVSIRKLENDYNFGQKHMCGGVIIRPNFILTAAHCVISGEKLLRPSSIRVVAGTPKRLYKTLESQILRVKKIIIHHSLSSSGSLVDIALLQLRRNIKLDKNCAAVITLPKQRINDSTTCAVLGWGKLYFQGPMANEILQLYVTLHSKQFCEMVMLEDSKSKICASDLRDSEKNPCSGDSGGPLICKGVLTGIVSYGFQCGYYGLPTVYTDVYEFRNWIKENNAFISKSWHAICLCIIVFVVLITYI